MSSGSSNFIKRLTVTGLFGRFNHDIRFDDGQNIAIITAPNGYGKTIVLRIIYSFFNRRLKFFSKIPFEKIEISLSSKKSIQIFKDPANHSDDEESDNRKSFSIKAKGFGSDSSNFRLSPNYRQSDLRALERNNPITRIAEDRWIDHRTDDYYSTKEIIEMYSDHLPMRVIESFNNKIPDWLQEVMSSVDLHLVETQRLLTIDEHLVSRHRSFRRQQKPLFAIEMDAKNLSNRISRLSQEYANVSQESDQTFPKRIIDQIGKEPISEEDIKIELELLEDKQEKLMSVGLLSKSVNEPIPPSDAFRDRNVRKILEIYIDDTKRKLRIFDKEYDKIRLFKQIINEHLSFKSIEIDAETGFLSKDDAGEVVPLSGLSSGEQHELVLLYELLFVVEPGATILIDEPELSLHVAWQKRFISDIQKIQELKNLKVIIATHSPQIINDRWDLVQELAKN